MVLLLKKKLYTYTLPRIQRGPLFSRGGGGVKLFPGGGSKC